MAHIFYGLFVLVALSPHATHARGATKNLLKLKANDETLFQVTDANSGGSCTDLLNKDTHFAVKVDVGTPPQSFELVADTGSDAVIVTSCVCVDQGFCLPNDKCFRGTNHSSTFKVSDNLMGKSMHGKSSKGPMGVAMTFGSGSVTSVIATDYVSVAGVKAKMEDGLLLMVDRRMLNIAGKFEGILGLGPRHNITELKERQEKLEEKAEKEVEKEMKPNSKMWPHAMKMPKPGPSYAPRLFSEKANVDRFTMCFNDAEKPGTLRLNVPAFKKPLPSIGHAHWGLGLFGITVGSKSSPIVLCDKDKMKDGMKSPCGAIPDSGTTLLMGPKDQISTLFSSLCESWDRCRKARKDKYKDLSASHAFQKLLYHCGDWITEKDGIDEVPSVFLEMGGPGHTQKVELTAWSYVVETMQPVYNSVVKYLFGVLPVMVDMPTEQTKKVCTPSFGVQDYNTLQNGPVWILGTPLFYQYTVGYSLSGPSISFMSEKCNNCDESSASLLSSQKELHQVQERRARRMRSVSSAPRVPYFDTSLPL